MLVAYDAWGQDKPTAMEIAQLPKFCYGQFGVPNASTPEFNIPEGCGPGMNHYCSGLIYLIRAKASGNKDKSLGQLRRAETGISYTERWMKDYPACPIRDHVAAKRTELNGLLKIGRAHV